MVFTRAKAAQSQLRSLHAIGHNIAARRPGYTGFCKNSARERFHPCWLLSQHDVNGKFVLSDPLPQNATPASKACSVSILLQHVQSSSKLWTRLAFVAACTQALSALRGAPSFASATGSSVLAPRFLLLPTCHAPIAMTPSPDIYCVFLLIR